MKRLLFCTGGLFSAACGAAGVFLPLLPTVPFMLLAAFCFAKGSPALERRLIEHPRFGGHIRAWRRSRSIGMSAKRAAWCAFGVSAAIGVVVLPPLWSAAPVLVAAIGSVWIARLPTAHLADAEESGPS